jgi:hypothetical protein
VGIERTQAIQYFQSNGQGSFSAASNNKVPLIANKPLVLRVYVNRTELPNLPIPVYIVGEVTLAGSAPIASDTPIRARPASSIDRGNRNHTLNFSIPADLCRDVVVFTVTVFDIAASENPGNPAYMSQPETFTAYFDPVPRLRIHGVLINYTGPDRNPANPPMNIAAPTPQQLVDTLSYVRRTYPISDINLTGTEVATFSGNLMNEVGSGCGLGWNQLLTMLGNLRAASNSTDVYVGLLPAGVPNLNFVGCGSSSTGSAAAYVNDGPTLAQEIGHALGRLHAPCGNPRP